MPFLLTHDAYGKSEVRISKISRRGNVHFFDEWTVAVQLEGDFAPAYTAGDNRNLIATDSMRNTVYVLARDHDFTSPEAFAAFLASHFIDTYPQASIARIEVVAKSWNRIVVEGQPHPHAFIAGPPGMRTAKATRSKAGLQLRSGIRDLPIVKTTDSAFRDFVTDGFRTLPDSDDRIFGTLLTAEWLHLDVPNHGDYESLVDILLTTFAGHKSLGVQQTLYAMGEAALTACPKVHEITLTLPNRHRIPFNLAPFGKDNPNVIFVATDEPYGLITGTLRRS